MLLLAKLACQFLSASTATVSGEKTAAENSAGENSATKPGEKNAAVTGTFNLADPLLGLDSLSRYHQHFVISIQGAAAGKPLASSQKLDRWVSGVDEARRVEAAQESGAPIHLQTARLEGYDYSQQKENGGCRVSDVTETNQPALDPKLPPVFGAEKAGWTMENEVEGGGTVSQTWKREASTILLAVMADGGNTQIIINA